MDWDPRVPTPIEAARDAHEDWLIDTYEERYSGFCHRTWRDPESVDSVMAFEEWWTEWEE